MAILDQKIHSQECFDRETELVIDSCLNDEFIEEMLLKAKEIEDKFQNGLSVNNGLVLLKGEFDPGTGLLNVTIEMEHGKVTYDALDLAMNKIRISSVPAKSCIRSRHELTEEEREEFQREFTNIVELDFKDFESIREAKNRLADDFVLKYQTLNNSGRDKASKFAIWHLRAYRKFFMKYYKAFNFLWRHTCFSNASALFDAVQKRRRK